MRPGAPIYVAHADTEGLNFRAAFRDAGLKLSGCLVWVKPSLVLGRSDYQWRHEPILYGWKAKLKKRLDLAGPARAAETRLPAEILARWK